MELGVSQSVSQLVSGLNLAGVILLPLTFT